MELREKLAAAGYSEEEITKIESSCKLATLTVDEYGLSLEEMLEKTAEFHDVGLEKTAGMSIDETEDFMRMENAGMPKELAAAVIFSVKTAGALVSVINAESEKKIDVVKLASIYAEDAIENSEIRIKMSAAGYSKEEIEKHIRGQL